MGREGLVYTPTRPLHTPQLHRATEIQRYEYALRGVILVHVRHGGMAGVASCEGPLCMRRLIIYLDEGLARGTLVVMRARFLGIGGCVSVGT